MPVYHSQQQEEGARVVCGCAIVPVKTTVRGPAPPASSDFEDIVDETINYFRANVMFRNFEIKGAADRTLVYLTLYTAKCLSVLATCPSKADGSRKIFSLGVETPVAPGEGSFALSGFIPNASSREEADLWKSYFRQLREELGSRLLTRVYNADGTLNKWWLSFSKRKFMNKSL
eukprot:GILK01002497.1.p1 GENE.GILK01002497.1~~GILK01002497.1.p1  ORF type:complete len:174 (-),score=17.81 GILK01002497.1:146-667(-)